ncbi:MAG: hypothetical protein AB1730_00265 [Myxococcota bacterium]|jgi:hypothetical protein
MHTLLLLALAVAPGTATDSRLCAAETFSDAEARYEAWSREPDDAVKPKEAVAPLVRDVKPLAETFQRIAAAGCGERSVNALVLSTRAIVRLAQRLTALPPPPGLIGDDVDLYRGELETLCLSLFERARPMYEAALKRAVELHVSNPYVEDERRWLEANPARRLRGAAAGVSRVTASRARSRCPSSG